MNQTILDTENENIKLILRTNANNIEHLRQVTSTSGEITDANDLSVTVETITITRTILTTIV